MTEVGLSYPVSERGELRSLKTKGASSLRIFDDLEARNVERILGNELWECFVDNLEAKSISGKRDIPGVVRSEMNVRTVKHQVSESVPPIKNERSIMGEMSNYKVS
jgi:hypothetical protein